MGRFRGGCCLYLFLSVFAVAGIGVTVWGARILSNASVSRGWPSTQGEIAASTVRMDSDSDGTTYHAEVSFQYVVADRRYTADTVNFGQYGTGNPNHAQEIVNNYPVGKIVTVYYDPSQPETAVLEPGVTWSSYMVLGMGLLFTIISIIVMAASLLRPLFRF